MNGKQLTLGLGLALYGGVVWFADPFLIVLGFAAVLWGGVPVAFIAACMLFSAVCTGRSRQPALTMLAVAASAMLLTGLAWPLNHLVQERAVAAAKAYPERVAPLLEAYRQAHGSYPASLDQLPAKPAVPRLLRGLSGYHSDGRSYSFYFPQPGGMIDTWDYDSDSKQWHLST